MIIVIQVAVAIVVFCVVIVVVFGVVVVFVIVVRHGLAQKYQVFSTLMTSFPVNLRLQC